MSLAGRDLNPRETSSIKRRDTECVQGVRFIIWKINTSEMRSCEFWEEEAAK